MAKQKEQSTPGDRLQWFIVENYISVPAYAEQFGFNASQLYRVINNTSSPRLETLVLYAQTGLNLHWLGTGNGNWWSPDEKGRELARRQGIVVDGDGSETAIDYAALVRSVFETVEECVVEKMMGQQKNHTIARTSKAPKVEARNKTRNSGEH